MEIDVKNPEQNLTDDQIEQQLGELAKEVDAEYSDPINDQIQDIMSKFSYRSFDDEIEADLKQLKTEMDAEKIQPQPVAEQNTKFESPPIKEEPSQIEPAKEERQAESQEKPVQPRKKNILYPYPAPPSKLADLADDLSIYDNIELKSVELDGDNSLDVQSEPAPPSKLADLADDLSISDNIELKSVELDGDNSLDVQSEPAPTDAVKSEAGAAVQTKNSQVIETKTAETKNEPSPIDAVKREAGAAVQTKNEPSRSNTFKVETGAKFQTKRLQFKENITAKAQTEPSSTNTVNAKVNSTVKIKNPQIKETSTAKAQSKPPVFKVVEMPSDEKADNPNRQQPEQDNNKNDPDKDLGPFGKLISQIIQAIARGISNMINRPVINRYFIQIPQQDNVKNVEKSDPISTSNLHNNEKQKSSKTINVAKTTIYRQNLKNMIMVAQQSKPFANSENFRSCSLDMANRSKTADPSIKPSAFFQGVMRDHGYSEKESKALVKDIYSKIKEKKSNIEASTKKDNPTIKRERMNLSELSNSLKSINAKKPNLTPKFETKSIPSKNKNAYL